MFEFHVSRTARERYGVDDALFSLTGNVVFANIAASRELAHRMNSVRDVEKNPTRTVHPAALHAMGLIDEALHAVIAQYRKRDPAAVSDALTWFAARLGMDSLDRTLLAFAKDFPVVSVHRGRQSAEEWLAGTTAGVPHRTIALEEMILLWLANANPAFRPFQELFDDSGLRRLTSYPQITAALHDYFATRPRFGPGAMNLIDLLRAPALASPDSLEGQLAFMRDQWPGLIGDLVLRMVTALDALKEEEIAIWMRFHPPVKHFGGPTFGDSSAAAVPRFSHAEHEYERFTADQDWMPRAVVLAKSVHVWLDQLSKTYKRSVNRLDQIPDEELDLLARRGFNGLWLIGLWERSRASQRIKQMCGNPEAAASAYSLADYAIAEELGGESACANLRDRAWARGIRLASDMVPNHMGIDSRWMIEHPDWFLSLPHSPFPAYTFHGPDVGGDGRVEIKIEDHYFDRSDAAVVFRRLDRWTGDTRFIYHGNDGTSFPWNDTAQLNYLKAEVREAVIQTILHVARMFPIIRFDAAMTLAKRHYQRLWFPEPGSGGGIPSRAEHGLTKAEFDGAMPVEFWREVVDRVAAEAPNTLLLAEAFWLMEGYFVRTLGMHRVYNSAFMNMLRDEENANYRSVIKNTLSFDPDVLKRFVNFMNNPDERTAVDQFGKGDKYFGVCTLMATLPGLPMFGHGQIEGFNERYGMEYRRAYYDEQPDSWLVARHEREITPLLHRRHLFAEARNFLLYDFFTESGHVNEDVFAYSNRHDGQHSLVIFNNRYATTQGWIRTSCAFAEKSEHGKRLRQSTLAESFGFRPTSPAFSAFRDMLTGLEYLHRVHELAERGLRLELHAYQTHVFLEWRELHEDAEHPWGKLCDELAGRGVPDLEDAVRLLVLRPLHEAFRAVMDPVLAKELAGLRSDNVREKSSAIEAVLGLGKGLLNEAERQIAGAELAERTTEQREFAQELFEKRLRAAVKLFVSQKEINATWGLASRGMPSPDGNKPSEREQLTHRAAWAGVLGWCALEAIGAIYDHVKPEAVAQVFDQLRLREPLAAAFAAYDLKDGEEWRAAARIRASFAHGTEAANEDWTDDRDATWAVGAHEYEGVTYVVREDYERMLWWAALPELLDVGATEPVDFDRLKLLEDEIKERMNAIEKARYKFEALRGKPLLTSLSRENRLQKR